MRAVKISILATLIFLLLGLAGCAKPAWMPAYPEDLTEFHYFEIKQIPMTRDFAKSVSNLDEVPVFLLGEEYRCLEFQVVKINPYEFKYIKQDELSACHELFGMQVGKMTRLFNWIDDVFKKADKNQCFVNKP